MPKPLPHSREFSSATTPIPTGLSLIEASAGTGKTYAISHLVPRLLLEGTLSKLSELLLVTYTKDAAGELSDRVRRVLSTLAAPARPSESSENPGVAELRNRFLTGTGCGEAKVRIERALLDIDQLSVSTIHSFCQRILQIEGTLCGLPSLPELITDTYASFDEALFDLWREHITNDPVLSILATVQGWSIDGDRRLVLAYAGLEKPAFIPPPARDFIDACAQLKPRLGQPASQSLLDLCTLARSVVQWNTTSAPSEACRLSYLERIERGPASFDLSFLEALGFLGGLPNGIAKTPKLNKPIIAAIEASPGLQHCKSLLKDLQDLRWVWQRFCAEQSSLRVRDSLRANRQITYDGLISTLRDALAHERNGPLLAARLQERHTIGIIDESQDTDPRQFEIFERIFLRGTHAHRLLLIGDPKQAIYGFRGANLDTYLGARELACIQESRTPEVPRVFHLTKTYRAPRGLVGAVNAVFSRGQSLLNPGLDFTPATSALKAEGTRLVFQGEAGAFLPAPSLLEVWHVPDEDQEAYSSRSKRLGGISRRVASEILRLLQRGFLHDTTTPDAAPRQVAPGDVAVLVSTHEEADAMAEALRAVRIPVVVSSAGDVLDTEEARELELLLQALDQPRKAGLRYAALASRLLGFSCTDIHALRGDARADEAWLERFREWQATWETRGFAALIGDIEAHCCITRRLARSSAGERRCTNYRQVVGLLQELALHQATTPGHQLRWLRQEIARAEGRTNAEERQLQLESGERAVRIVTMHKAKGLEYNLVFCPFLWSGNRKGLEGTQILRKGGSRTEDALYNTDLGAETASDVRAAFLRSYLEDRIRLAYVALTRAKVKAWLYAGALAGPKSNPPLSALDWLLRPDATQPAPEAASNEAFLAWVESAETPSSLKGNTRCAGRGSRQGKGIEQIAVSSQGTVAFCTPPEETAPLSLYAPEQLTGPKLAAETAPAVPSAWHITSFSGLTREKQAHGGAPFPVHNTGAAPEPAEAPADNSFLTAPAGAAIGTLVHDFIERWDFSIPDPAVVRAQLLASHFKTKQGNPEELEHQLLSLFNALRLAHLPGLPSAPPPSFPISRFPDFPIFKPDFPIFTSPFHQACPAAHSSEWHFHLPIAAPGLTGVKLADAFARHGYPAYAESLQLLSTQDINGFLQGFIDRLVCQRGHWGVIDWKTNRLGTRLEDYDPEALLRSAWDSHYFLQTHLYLVALRRYLRRIGRPFELAGAWLVYLRAVKPGSTQGILHITPPSALLDALDALFSQATDAHGPSA